MHRFLKHTFKNMKQHMNDFNSLWRSGYGKDYRDFQSIFINGIMLSSSWLMFSTTVKRVTYYLLLQAEIIFLFTGQKTYCGMFCA